jgi:polysaccharide pyruvyl transferase WcaK-like protein
LCRQADVQNMIIAYQHPAMYSVYHHEFGYPRIDMHSKFAVVRAILRSKSIIVGGGGLWGLDFRFNELLMSIMLFVSRRLLGKKVYLIGVGHYNSTTRLGRLGAFLASKAANTILARDTETHINFSKFNKETHLDTDIAWYLRNVRANEYREDLADLEREAHITSKTLVVTLRRFQAKHRNNFTSEVEKFLVRNPNRHVIVALLEPQHIDPEQYEIIKQWEKKYPNVQALLTPRNPLALFLFFNKYRHHLALVAPQFHAIITAHLNGVPFMPIIYDNKVAELLKYIGHQQTIPIHAFSHTHLQLFANDFYGGVA